MKIQIYGPYFTNYSLARVNRNLGLALRQIDAKVSLWCDPEDIDYLPSKDELRRNNLDDIVFLDESPDISIFNNFPKSINHPLGLSKLRGTQKFAYIAWEESVYPSHWVKEINENLAGVFVTTSFVKEILDNSGVTLPIFVVHASLDRIASRKPSQNYPIKSNKNFKFLHISTFKKRKGGDLLIKSFLDTFSAKDDVVLVIKTGENPDNEIQKILDKYRQLSGSDAEIEVISNNALSDDEIASLHLACDAEVYPSRAEGFGLPQLESISFGNPVIVTNYSSYLDFLNFKNAFLLDYKLTNAVDSELVNVGAKWAEPEIDQLGEYMRLLYKSREEIRNSKQKVFSGSFKPSELSEIGQKIYNGVEKSKEFSWIASAKKMFSLLEMFRSVLNLKEINIGIVSSINDDSGISEYTKNLFKSSLHFFQNFFFISNRDIIERKEKDLANTFRLWNTSDSDATKVIDFVIKNNINILHIQHHSAQISTDFIDNLVDGLKSLETKIFITFHNLVANKINFAKSISSLNLLSGIFIHNQKDFDILSKFFNPEKIKLLLHSKLPFRNIPKKNLKKLFGLNDRFPIISTHGLLNTNKNIESILYATSVLKKTYPKVLFLSLNALSSNNILASSLSKELRELAKKLDIEENVLWVDDFLSEQEIIHLLGTTDVILFPYQDVGESASGAISKAFASGVPVIVSDIPTFKEFDKEVFKISNIDPKSICDAVITITTNKNLSFELVEKAKELISSNSIDRKTLETLCFYSRYI